jgi:hypothetical protein
MAGQSPPALGGVFMTAKKESTREKISGAKNIVAKK